MNLTFPILPPKDYQLPFWRAADSGIRNHLLVHSRRAGKDITACSYVSREAVERPGAYAYCLPEYQQARKVVWEGKMDDGTPILDTCFPEQIIEKKRDQDMTLFLKTGSIVKFIGSDNADTALVGMNLNGFVMSEAALSDKKAFDLVQPILLRTKGWQLIISTYRGFNWFYKLGEYAKANPKEWFFDLRTVEDVGYATRADIEKLIAQGMPRPFAMQEFFCIPYESEHGTIYGSYVTAAKETGRVCDLPYDPRFPVIPAFDIGRDTTVVTYWQRKGEWLDCIDCDHDTGQLFPHFLNVLRSKPYAYGGLILPHDGDDKSVMTNDTPRSTSMNFGFMPTMAPKLRTQTGIEATRVAFPKMRFDRAKCEKLLEALSHYQYKWDDDTKTFSTEPKHDWSSHFADSVRTFVVTPSVVTMAPQWVRELTAQPSPWGQQFGATGYGGLGQSAQQLMMQREPNGGEYDPLAAYRG